MEENTNKKENKEKKKKSEIIQELEEKNQKLEEECLRSKADLINYRKRKDEEMANFIKYANSDLIESLLLIVDNFERALALKEEELTSEMKNFLLGFKMIYTSFKEILSSYGVKEIESLGKKFDSRFHNCLFTEEHKDKEEEEILEVITKGYTYNDKVLRCASVKVNKKPKEEETNESKEKEDEKNE